MAGKSIDDLGSLQRAIMEIVWELGKATVNQVRDRLNDDRKKQLAYTTVLSSMQKLEKLGWLRHRSQGPVYVYRPRRSRAQEGADSLRRFIRCVFDGDPKVAFEHLIEHEHLTDDDLTTLKRMIDKRRKELRDG